MKTNYGKFDVEVTYKLPGATTLSITTLSITILNIMTLSITTFNIKINETRHSG